MDSRQIPLPPEPITPEDLRVFRARMDWTQTDLSVALGVHYSTVNRWENPDDDERRPIPLMVRLALDALAADRPEGGTP